MAVGLERTSPPPPTHLLTQVAVPFTGWDILPCMMLGPRAEQGLRRLRGSHTEPFDTGKPIQGPHRL